jgi:hypothetical protein
MPRTTPAQRFAKFFALSMDPNAAQGERDSAARKMDEWLKRHGKTRADIQAILVQAAADDAAAQPPPPPSDPRDGAPHPFDSSEFNPADLVEGIVCKYLWMREHERVLFVLWIIFTHVYTKFRIAPRVALVSENPDSGKTTALDVARLLVFRPNPEALGTGPAIREFLDQGSGTVMLDELDQLDAEARRALLRIWNLGHKRGEKVSLMVGGKRKVFNLYAPMIAAGVGDFLGATQMSRAYKFGMEPYDENTKPKKEFDDEDEDIISGLNNVYSYLRHWVATVKLDLRPCCAMGA